LFEKANPASANIGQILLTWKRQATIFERMEEIDIFGPGFVLFLTEVLRFIEIFSLSAPVHGFTIYVGFIVLNSGQLFHSFCAEKCCDFSCRLNRLKRDKLKIK
jgi:hypothetical protein